MWPAFGNKLFRTRDRINNSGRLRVGGVSIAAAAGKWKFAKNVCSRGKISDTLRGCHIFLRRRLLRALITFWPIVCRKDINLALVLHGSHRCTPFGVLWIFGLVILRFLAVGRSAARGLVGCLRFTNIRRAHYCSLDI